MPNKVLVVYFSLTGRTRMVAKAIAKEIGADLEEISPLQPYPLRGAFLYVHGGMQALFGRTPPIEPLIAKLAEYDMFVIGTPIWAGKISPPMRTFLNQNQFTGKRVAFFCTSGGGGSDAPKEMLALSKGVLVGELEVKMAPKVADASLKQVRTWAKQL